jgi:hypothetical protein
MATKKKNAAQTRISKMSSSPTLASFDFKTNSNTGVDYELRSIRDYSKTGIVFTMLGLDSDIAAEIFRNRKIKDSERDFVKNPFTEDDLVERSAEMLAALTLNWVGVRGGDGVDIPFTKDAAKAVYVQYEAIRGQLNEFVSDRANFLLE